MTLSKLLLRSSSILCTTFFSLSLTGLNAVTIGANASIPATQSTNVPENLVADGYLYVSPEGTYYSPSSGGYSYAYATPSYNTNGNYYGRNYTSGYYYTPPQAYGYYNPYGSYYGASPYYNVGYGGWGGRGWGRGGNYYRGGYHGGRGSFSGSYGGHHGGGHHR